MSEVKDVKDISGRAVVYNGVVITAIVVPDRFVNAIPSPLPNKKFLSEDDIVNILCDIIPNTSEEIEVNERVGLVGYGEVDLYRANFEYFNEDGVVVFSVHIKKGILVVFEVILNIKIKA